MREMELWRDKVENLLFADPNLDSKLFYFLDPTSNPRTDTTFCTVFLLPHSVFS